MTPITPITPVPPVTPVQPDPQGTTITQPPDQLVPQQDTSPHEYGRLNEDLYPIGPYYAEYGRPHTIPLFRGEPEVTIPVAKLGWAPLPPAEWATYFKEYALSVYSRTRITTEIRTLRDAPSRNEPLLRHEKPISGLMLCSKIAHKPHNMESALIQVVGTNEPTQCRSCDRGNGPWAKCISFHGDQNSITCCGNCQWNANGARCDLPRNRPQ